MQGAKISIVRHSKILASRKDLKKMDLITGIKERRSIRKFQDKPIPHELLEEIVNIAAYAPSWKNTQIARYIVVEDRAKIEALANDACTLGFTYNIKTLAHAPALVLVTMVNGRSGYEKDGSFSTPKGAGWEMFDAGIAAQTFCLAAFAKGLGTVIMGVFDENKVAEIIDIPEGQQLAVIIPIGYPTEDEVTAPPRKDASKLLSFVE